MIKEFCMKFLCSVILVLVSFTACSKDEAPKAKNIKAVEVSTEAEVKKVAPCDSKEDIIKKLEEKKKAEAESGKGFSLQGGSTGCSVK